MPAAHHRIHAGTRTFLMLLLLNVQYMVNAQTFTLESAVGSSGGGTSEGGPFRVEGAIGQPAAGTFSGGPYRIDSGFWGGVQVVQVAGRPQLRMIKSDNSILIFWEDEENRFVLQESENLNASEWTTSQRNVVSVGAIRQVILSHTTGRRFFRLSMP